MLKVPFESVFVSNEVPSRETIIPDKTFSDEVIFPKTLVGFCCENTGKTIKMKRIEKIALLCIIDFINIFY